MTWGSRRSRRALTALAVGLVSLVATAPAAATTARVAGEGTSAAAGVDLTAVLAALVGFALLAWRRRE